MKDGLYVGVITGTSMDAIDAAVIQVDDNGLTLKGHQDTPIPKLLSDKLRALAEAQSDTIELLASADLELGRIIAQLINDLLAKLQIDKHSVVAIGSHGQTIRHIPAQAYTLQIGDPSTIAERTGILCVSDFRRPDMAAGGEGAPLASRFHLDHFSSDTRKRCILNLGGIANITIIGKGVAEGYDTGPANRLMDDWAMQHIGQPYDQDGNWARAGKVDQELLRNMLNEPYFSQTTPKSTGRELFNRAWLEKKLGDNQYNPEDVQRTLLELTAASISHCLSKHLQTGDEVILCGGGAFNGFLRERLEVSNPSIAFMTSNDIGVHPQHVEAAAFAWLAYLRVNHKPGNVPQVTGANRDKILGALYSP